MPQAGRPCEIYRGFRDHVALVCACIRQAHPSDGWQVLVNLREEFVYAQPTGEDERAAGFEAALRGQIERAPGGAG